MLVDCNKAAGCVGEGWLTRDGIVAVVEKGKVPWLLDGGMKVVKDWLLVDCKKAAGCLGGEGWLTADEMKAVPGVAKVGWLMPDDIVGWTFKEGRLNKVGWTFEEGRLDEVGWTFEEGKLDEEGLHV